MLVRRLLRRIKSRYLVLDFKLQRALRRVFRRGAPMVLGVNRTSLAFGKSRPNGETLLIAMNACYHCSTFICPFTKAEATHFLESLLSSRLGLPNNLVEISKYAAINSWS